MPATSEGFENTGLEPNSTYDPDKRDPAKFDPQTAEIFLQRLNKALGAAERTTFEEAIALVGQYRGAVANVWRYFHQRIQGLSCGLEGTWEQALNELTAHIKNLYAQIKTLEQQQIRVTAEKGALVDMGKVTVLSPRLAPAANGSLQETDRALLIEKIPELIERIEKLEKLVVPPQVDPSC